MTKQYRFEVLLDACSRTGCSASMDHPLEALHWSIFPKVLARVKILLMADLHLSSDLSDSFEIKEGTQRRMRWWKEGGELTSLFNFSSPKILDQYLGLSPKRNWISSNLTCQRRLPTPRSHTPLLRLSHSEKYLNFVAQNSALLKVGVDR